MVARSAESEEKRQGRGEEGGKKKKERKRERRKERREAKERNEVRSLFWKIHRKPESERKGKDRAELSGRDVYGGFLVARRSIRTGVAGQGQSSGNASQIDLGERVTHGSEVDTGSI